MKKSILSLKRWLFNLHLIAFVCRYIEDILIFSGIGFITFATFMLSTVAGYYCLGGCLLALGVWFMRNPIRKG